jgi:peptidoglycan-associated lipoprotein
MMMRSLKMAAVTGLVMTGLAVSGCATKKYVNTQVGAVDSRVTQHDSQIGELDKTSREALERATDAGKLAEGKFLYSVVLSDDSVKFPLNPRTCRRKPNSAWPTSPRS